MLLWSSHLHALYYALLCIGFTKRSEGRRLLGIFIDVMSLMVGYTRSLWLGENASFGPIRVS